MTHNRSAEKPAPLINQAQGFISLKLSLSIAFIFLSCLYFSTARFVVGVNDGSQYALTAAMALENRFSINSFVDYTMRVDYAFKNGNYYSDRTLAPALLALPIIHFRRLINTDFHTKGSHADSTYETKTKDAEIIREAALIPNAIMGALSVILLYLIAKSLGLTQTSASAIAVLFSLGSLNWKYSSLFMGHVPSSFFVLLCIYFSIRKDLFTRSLTFISFSFVLGFIPLCRYENVFLIVPILFFVVFRYWQEKPSLPKLVIATGILVFISPILFLCLYHVVAFGHPLATYSEYYNPARMYWYKNPQIPVAKGGGYSASLFFTRPLLQGLYITFTSWPVVGTGKIKTFGFLVLQPVLILSLVGYIFFYLDKSLRKYFFLISSVTLISVIGNAMTWGIDGGGMRDPRYTVTVLPLLFLPAAFFINGDKLRSLKSPIFWIFGSFGIVFCLFHFIETDNFYARGEIIWLAKPLMSMLDYRVFENIYERLFISRKLIYLAFYTSLALLTIYITISKLLTKISVSKIVYFIGGSFLFLNTALILLISYTFLNKDNPFNTFPDTLQISGSKVKVAVRETGFVKPLPNAKESQFSHDTRNSAGCEYALSASSASDIIFESPSEARVLTGFLLSLQPKENLNQNENQTASKIEFAIDINDKRAWELSPESLSYGGNFFMIQIVPNSKIKLRVLRNEEQNYGMEVGWCNLKLE
ncbi:MAG TPA: glycosyltransferase family 39 protein [Oligoflexia bacterium]|nr:glycosyltransferase family 39 protein [Oligoflexia bacterium]HMP49245.1 glycosyltransferase family 39 protein [Oligoflexia bacterium]